MGTTLTGTTPQDTYDSLIKVTDNGPLSGTAKYLSDGLGNDSVLAVSTAAVGIGTNTPSEVLEVSKTQSAITRLQITNAQTGGSTSIRASLRVTANDRIGEFVAVNGDSVYVGAASNHTTVLMSNGAGVLHATPAGNVGISTSTPDSKLRIQNDNATVPSLTIRDGGTPTVDHIRVSSGTYGDAFFVKAAGNVGIGTSTPECKLHVAGTASGSDVTLYIDNAAGSTLNNSSRLKFSSDAGSSVSSGGAELNCLVVDAGNGAVDLLVKTWTGGAYTEKARFLAGGGLTFNGDTAAANALDDYEEGTWTPTLGGTWTTNPTSLFGSYTKIGNMVYIRLGFTGGVKASSVAGWFDGLPFSGAVGGGGTVSNVSVQNKGIALLDNDTRVWVTETDFGGIATKVMASYRL